MNARLIFRVTAPVVAVSLLLLAVGVGTALVVQHWQEKPLRLQRPGVNVGADARRRGELEILVHEVRTLLDQFLITGNREYLLDTSKKRPDTERWLGKAEGWSIIPYEQELMARARKGHEKFWSKLEHISLEVPPDKAPTEVRKLIDKVLDKELLKPTHTFLDHNEEEVEEAVTMSHVFGDRLVYALLIIDHLRIGRRVGGRVRLPRRAV